MPARAPQHHRWTDLSSQALTESIQRRYFTADRVTVARFELKKGGVVPRHAHDNEQVSCVLTGALRFQFDDREVVVGAGEVMQIPGGIAHEVTVLEDTVVMDIFSPVRQDWIDGTDTYFTRRD
jgi:unsaturated pyranuronate lyase